MTRIVQDLLTLSRIDYGKMEMNVSRFSFAKAVRSVYEAVALNAESHGHTLSFQCEENMPDVNGDRERIEQVVMNIVSNAIKYTPDGGRIEIRAGRSGKNVYVRVSDNGIGIPERICRASLSASIVWTRHVRANPAARASACRSPRRSSTSTRAISASSRSTARART